MDDKRDIAWDRYEEEEEEEEEEEAFHSSLFDS
jgi:hypothetical protein